MVDSIRGDGSTGGPTTDTRSFNSELKQIQDMVQSSRESVFANFSLSQAKRESLRQDMLKTIEAAADTYADVEAGIVSWGKTNTSKHMLPVRKGSLPGNKVPCFQAWTTVDAELKEICPLLFGDTTERYRKESRLFYGKKLEQCRVLDVLIPMEDDGTGGRWMMTLKWFCLNGKGAFSKAKDFVVIDYVRHYKTEEGVAVLCRVMKSVTLQGLPSLRQLGITRGNVLSSIEMFTETKSPGYINATALMHMDVQDSIKALGSHYAENFLVNNLKTLGVFVLTKRVTKLHMKAMRDQGGKPNENDPACGICLKSFWQGRKRQACMGCLTSVCAECTISLNALIPRHNTLMVCFNCVLFVKSKPTAAQGDSSNKELRRKREGTEHYILGLAGSSEADNRGDAFSFSRLSSLLPESLAPIVTRRLSIEPVDSNLSEPALRSLESPPKKEHREEVYLRVSDLWDPNQFMQAAKGTGTTGLQTAKHFTFEFKKAKKEKKSRSDSIGSDDSGSWQGDEDDLTPFELPAFTRFSLMYDEENPQKGVGVRHLPLAVNLPPPAKAS